MGVGLLVSLSARGSASNAPKSSAAATPRSSGTDATREMDAGIAKQLDSAIDQTMTAASIPGAIIGVWGPGGQYVRAVGVADKATGAPMKTDFYSRIGSVTKTFTVTGVLQLADQGKLGLDDPIGNYIDGVPRGDKITLRQLAQMRSGLENYANSTAFQQALVARVAQQFLRGEVVVRVVSGPPWQLEARSVVDGVEHRVSPVCPHLGGIVNWNDADESWECPLHGSRFAPDGTLLEGPAKRNLTAAQ